MKRKPRRNARASITDFDDGNIECSLLANFCRLRQTEIDPTLIVDKRLNPLEQVSIFESCIPCRNTPHKINEFLLLLCQA